VKKRKRSGKGNEHPQSHDCCDNGGDREKQNHQRENQYKNKTKRKMRRKKTHVDKMQKSRSTQNHPGLVPVLFTENRRLSFKPRLVGIRTKFTAGPVFRSVLWLPDIDGS
jgi:hypothetical protein